MKKILMKLMVLFLCIQTVNPVIFNSDSTVHAATTMTNNIAIMIEFSDLTSTSLDSDAVLKNADIIMNDDGTATEQISTVYGNMPIVSLKNFIKKYSYGTKDIQTTFFPQDTNGKVVSYTAPHPRSYYLRNSEDGYGNDSAEMLRRRKELLDGALESAKTAIESTYSANDLDTNGDGYVDAVTFFVEGESYFNDQSKVSWRDLLWSHKSEINFSTKLNGKSVYTYSLINTYDPTGIMGAFSLNRSGYGTILHEYMHVLGLMDLYRSSGDGYPVGQYDLMGDVVNFAPQGLLAYHLSDELGWHAALPTISSSQRITVTKPQYNDSQEVIAVKLLSPLNKNEIIVAEYYNADNYKGAKGNASEEDGLLLYRVKTDEYKGNINGSVGNDKDQLYIYRPDETGLNAGDGTMKNAVLRYSTTRSSLGQDLSEAKEYNNQALYYSNGNNSGIKVNIVSQTEDGITFDVTIPTTQGSGTQTDPYLLSSKEDLDLLNSDTSTNKTYYKLINDIDFEGSSISGFSTLYGELDGNGYTIKNINIKGAGFLDQIYTGAIVKNLSFSNINVQYEGKGYAGIVAGTNYGTISNVHITSGTITGNSARNTGGITGTLGNIATITDSSTAADVLSPSGGNGGLVGLYQGNDGYYSGGKITNSYVSGKVVQGAQSSGAVIASSFNSITDGNIQNVYYNKNTTGIETAMGDQNIAGIYYVSLSSIQQPFISQGTIDLTKYWDTSGNIVPTYSVSNQDIATCKENQLIMQNAGSTNYTASIALGNDVYHLDANLTLTVQDMVVTSKGYTGIYDGKAHTITLNGIPSGSTIQYRTSTNGSWTSTKPSRTTAGTTTVYYQITNPNYNTVSGSATITINKATISVSAKGYTGIYDGRAHTITLSGVPSGSTIQYRTSTSGSWTSAKPSRTTAGTTTVYYQITNPNYNTVSGSAAITINKATASVSAKGYTGTYDGRAHTITLSGVSSGSTIQYRTSTNGSWTSAKPSRTTAGTTTVYYQITNPNYNTVSGNVTIKINKKSVSKLSISKISNRTYTGKQIKPGVTVKDGKTTLKNNKDYTLSYGKNKSIGKAYVKITGKGNYSGSVTKYFYIVPKKPSVSLKTGAGKITVTSKATGASGYQVAYSTSKNKGYKTVTSGSKKTISKLKKKKTYYIKVRAYKTVNGKKIYGSYSTVKKVKTK